MHTLTTPTEQLRRQRHELAERVAALTWDLGGLAYEMAIRDHYRLDVLSRRAAHLQQADAQLAEVQRLLATAQDGVAGQCRSCGAVHSRGAAYCWHCGTQLLAERRPAVLPTEDPPVGGPPVGGPHPAEAAQPAVNTREPAA
ncbi:MAG TPA: hypothetical protein VMG62_02530 [Solirubrobacteraceae bacterium]|nr:hypothetical protein [Solirubrobacteraceae bacterium]